MTILRRYPTWLLLQIGIALAALILAVVVAFEIKPLIEKKSQLEKEIASLQSTSNGLRAQISEIRHNLSASREAVYYVSMGINFYHAGNYTSAISSYDQALALDSLNGYILNLRLLNNSIFEKLFPMRYVR
jgi:tetratricopeptide (TPR) repeat protein